MRRLALIVLALGIHSLPTRAHDIPNARVDRSIQATLVPGRLLIDYEISLSELTLTRDLRTLTGSLPGVDPRDWFATYGRETGPLNGRGLLVAVDRELVDLRFLGFDLTIEEHPRFMFHYEARTPPGGHMTILDTNFVESEGTSRLAVRGREGVTIRGDDLPPDVASIAIRPVWQLSDAEERRTKQVAFDYATVAPLAASEKSTSPAPARPPLPSSPPRPRPSLNPGFANARLTRLLDLTSAPPLLGLIALALGLGAVHAFQPGHGKTLVAATVLDERGTWFRGVVLAIVTTLTHTGSVMLVALALWWTRTTRYGEINLGLTHVAGGLIAAIGLWRLGRHLAGYGEHDEVVILGGEAEVDRRVPLSTRGLVGLGVAGGLVPCWDAVVLIVLAEATGRLALGMGLLLAFGLGMALVLIAVGILAGRLRGLVVRGPVEAARGPWERRLGIASSLTLAAIGIYLLGIS